MPCSIPRGLSGKRTIESWNGAYHRGMKDFPAPGHRLVKYWCIFGMPRMWQQQLHPQRPTGCNLYPTKIEGYARGSRAASCPGIANVPAAVGFSRVTGRRAQERRSQFKNNRQKAVHTWAIGRFSSCGFSLSVELHQEKGHQLIYLSCLFDFIRDRSLPFRPLKIV